MAFSPRTKRVLTGVGLMFFGAAIGHRIDRWVVGGDWVPNSVWIALNLFMATPLFLNLARGARGTTPERTEP